MFSLYVEEHCENCTVFLILEYYLRIAEKKQEQMFKKWIVPCLHNVLNIWSEINWDPCSWVD